MARIPTQSASKGGVQNSTYTYAADAEASDAYAITLDPAPSAYAEGQSFSFKANTANTGASSLNVNGLGAKTLKKLTDQDTATGDIESGSIVEVVYDGTNFQIVSILAAVTETDPVVGAVTGIVKADGGGNISAAVEDTDYQGVPAEGAFVDGDKTKLDGIETAADVTDAVNIASSIVGADAKATPIDADTVPIIDSADSSSLKEVTWANVKATIKAYYDSVTATLTNKRVTPRITTEASSATPTINTDNTDLHSITALAAAITSFTTNLSGTPTNGQKLIIRIKDDGTGRAITWGASFEAKGVDLPTTTTASKVLTVGFLYDTVTSKWGCVASADEA